MAFRRSLWVMVLVGVVVSGLTNIQHVAAAATAELRGATSADREVEQFMKCAMPFYPTKRLRTLMKNNIISSKPIGGMDGIAYFVPKRPVKYYGNTILIIGGFDPNEWADFYFHSPGTQSSPQTQVYLAGEAGQVKLSIPASERGLLSIQQYEGVGPRWLSSIEANQNAEHVTVVACFGSNL